ncbi:MAG: hypothetical protein F4Z31_01040 [Gemmatimonadetes bacterium]|nr:hypothetical protein [Gemmatimonadota bacterium]MYA40372.1 hypothetical protein [Gemmatimonadota bacterium]MYE95531.1 hypothetical protein [Gemmatimonadota bacterium]MYJ11570.1 hypothetical protein [Gemmatimonadota bacterium]
MAVPTLDALRFARGWTRSASEVPFPGVAVESMTLRDDAGTLSASRYRPSSGSPPRPGWVLLHGATRPGHEHTAIVRFAAALASTGGDVIVPEVRAWRRLELDPAPALHALEAATEHMCAHPDVQPGGVVLVGLSFGCPQALIAGADLAARGLVRGVLGYGGYHDLLATVRFGLTGQFRRNGRTGYLRPDPYGRWVVAANYLHRIPGYEGTEDVSRALGRLAAMAGDHGFMSWEPSSDPFKDDVIESVSVENRELFRLFAPPAAQDPEPGRAREMVFLLTEAARTTHPQLELASALNGRALPPVRLIHGRQDHLIPFTETLALERFLRRRADVSATVTDLFAHSGEAGRSATRIVEAGRFLAAIRGAMALHRR